MQDILMKSKSRNSIYISSIKIESVMIFENETVPCTLQPATCNEEPAPRYPIACFKSSIKSSASSIPTLSLMSESESPFLILSSRGIEA